MDSITSQSLSESRQGTRATRILPMEAGHGVHLIATCLLNAQTSQMSVAEIYEWLAQKYPEYQYTKYKIRKVLKHDFERKCPRFVIANPGRIAGIPLRWMIRPGTEPQLRRCFGGPPPPRRPIPQFYGGLSQVIHCILCKRGFNGQESFVTHQREAHSRGATVSPTIHKGATVTHSTGAGSLGAPRAVHYRDELTNHVIGAESPAGAETEFVEEGSLFVDEMPIEMPIATNGGENRRNEEGELGASVYVGRSAVGDKTLKDAQIFEGAASRQISDVENSPVRGTVTVKMSPNESIAGHKG
jgi:hypothetical protein